MHVSVVILVAVCGAVLFLLTLCQCGNLFLPSIFDRHIKPNRNIWGDFLPLVFGQLIFSSMIRLLDARNSKYAVLYTLTT